MSIAYVAADSRVMVEKPFGNDEASAQALNETIHQYFAEDAVYRVDHWLGLDPVEITLAAGTKPYGFLGSMPGPGVGGHCIPCDPYYLLWQLAGTDTGTPGGCGVN